MGGEFVKSPTFALVFAIMFFLGAATSGHSLHAVVDGLAGIVALWLFFHRRRAFVTEKTRAANADPPMSAVRQNIDDLDDQLVTLLAKRQREIEAAAVVKRANNIPARVPERVDEVLSHVAARAEKENLDVALSQTVWRDIIEWSIAYEERLMRDPGAGVTGAKV